MWNMGVKGAGGAPQPSQALPGPTHPAPAAAPAPSASGTRPTSHRAFAAGEGVRGENPVGGSRAPPEPPPAPLPHLQVLQPGLQLSPPDGRPIERVEPMGQPPSALGRCAPRAPLHPPAHRSTLPELLMISTMSRCRTPSTLSPFTPVIVSPRAGVGDTHRGSGMLVPPRTPSDPSRGALTSLEPRSLSWAPAVHPAHEGEHLHAVPVLVVQPIGLKWGHGGGW